MIYYRNESQAPTWAKFFALTETFGLPNLSPATMNKFVRKLSKDSKLLKSV